MCPNHHVLFDNGAISVADDLLLVSGPGKLIVNPAHHISRDHLAYHREHLTVVLEDPSPNSSQET
ncbi:MAG: hypothetical protein ACFB50_03005 [Rubrobacteraceae bacterium]